MSLRILFLLVSLPTLLFAQAYKIEVNIKDVEDSVAYLGYHFEDKKYVADTAEMANGKAIFFGDKPLKKGIYFVYTGNFYHELIISDNQQFSITTSKEQSIQQAKIENSPENELFRDFQLNMVESQQKMRRLSEQLSKAGSIEDSTNIIEEMQNINTQSQQYQDDFIAAYPKSLVSQFMALMMKPDIPKAPEGLSPEEARSYQLQQYRARYWDGIDFSNSGILRTPLFNSRLNEFVDKLTYQHPDSLIVMADALLAKAEQNEDVFQFVLASLINKYNSSKVMGMDAVFVHLAKNYYLSGKASWANDELIKSFEEAVDKLSPNLIGNNAPNLVLRDTLLDMYTLRTIAPSEYTILYFYSPTCGHCKKKTPVMLDVWRGIADQGVQMIAVNVETDVDEWRKFVREYDLDCLNGSDPFKQSNFRYEYNLETTPTVYIVDEQFKIIAKKLDAEQVADFIDRHRKMKVQ